MRSLPSRNIVKDAEERDVQSYDFFAGFLLTRELKVLNIFKMYFLLCNKDLTKQIRTHGLLLKCKKILDIKSKICGRSRYRRFLEVARAAL